MELLQPNKYNFRYYLLYSKSSNEIFILFYKSETDFGTKDEETILESTYLPFTLKKYTFEETDTVKVTCEDNEYFINQFNNDIVNFCNNHIGSEAVHIENIQYTFRIALESRVFAACNNCANDIYLNLGYSSIRVGSSKLKPIRYFEFESGMLIPESTANVEIDNCKISSIDINSYENAAKDSHIINFIINKKCTINTLRQYAATMVSFVGQVSNGNDFMNSKISISYVNIYGQEVVDGDKYKERLYFSGVQSVTIGGILVESEVQYGNIIKVDKITSININNIERLINTVGEGSFITIGRVATVNLHNIRYLFTKQSTFLPNTNIFFFLPDNDGNLVRKINLFDSSFENPSDNVFNVCSLNNVEINSIFLSNCDIIGNNINIISLDTQSKILKLIYNNVVYSDVSDEISIPKSNKLALNNCSISSSNTLKVNSNHITIDEGMYTVKELIIDSEDMVFKLALNKSEIHANKLNILNSNTDTDGILFDRESIYEINDFTISGYKPIFNNTKFHIGNLTINSQDVINIINSAVFFEKTNVNFNINSSLIGDISIVGEQSVKTSFGLTLRDDSKSLKTNIFDFKGSEESPTVIIKTNSPIKSEFSIYDNEYVSISYENDYDSEQDSKIIFDNSLTDIEYKLITNSEKLCSFSKQIDEEKNKTIYTINKI